jgi:hypothetical protein
MPKPTHSVKDPNELLMVWFSGAYMFATIKVGDSRIFVMVSNRAEDSRTVDPQRSAGYVL